MLNGRLRSLPEDLEMGCSGSAFSYISRLLAVTPCHPWGQWSIPRILLRQGGRFSGDGPWLVRGVIGPW